MNFKKEKLVSLGLSDELADKVVDELKTAEKRDKLIDFPNCRNSIPR